MKSIVPPFPVETEAQSTNPVMQLVSPTARVWVQFIWLWSLGP